MCKYGVTPLEMIRDDAKREEVDKVAVGHFIMPLNNGNEPAADV